MVSNRQSLRLRNYDYTLAGAYFVTICAYRRQLLFEDKGIEDVIYQTWLSLPEHFPSVATDAFVIMPNHVHGIVWILKDGAAQLPCRGAVGAQHAAPLRWSPVRRLNVPPGSLGAIVRSFKSAVTKRINESHGPSPLWQRNYYERVIRSEIELARVREYISLNPLKWRLDRENPSRSKDTSYEREWSWLEGDILA